MSHNYARIIFFQRGNYGTPFSRYGTVLPETDFTFRKFITCLSLLAKQISHGEINSMIGEIDFIFVFGSI